MARETREREWDQKRVRISLHGTGLYERIDAVVAKMVGLGTGERMRAAIRGGVIIDAIENGLPAIELRLGLRRRGKVIEPVSEAAPEPTLSARAPADDAEEPTALFDEEAVQQILAVLDDEEVK